MVFLKNAACHFLSCYKKILRATRGIFFMAKFNVTCLNKSHDTQRENM